MRYVSRNPLSFIRLTLVRFPTTVKPFNPLVGSQTPLMPDLSGVTPEASRQDSSFATGECPGESITTMG